MTAAMAALAGLSGPVRRVAKPTNAATAADFQATMMAQLLKPALPRLVSAFGGRGGAGSEMMEQFAGQILSDALAQNIAARDPFNLTALVLDSIEARQRQATPKGPAG